MAHSDSLVELADLYGKQYGRTTIWGLLSLSKEYAKSRATSILDAASIGLAFDVIFSEQTVDLSKITPDMVHAWELAYPHVPIQSLAGRSTEELAGAISGWKGKLFEVEVESRLNNGEWVGDLHLQPDQVAYLADSPTQPGWDLRILDSDGGVADTIQLKATESVSYIHEALNRYPDTPILATHEAASRMVDSGVLDSGILNEHLTSSVSDHLSDATSDSFSDGLAGAMPISVIALTETYKVLTGKKTEDQALASAGDRLAKGAVAGAVAAAVSVVATPFFGAIAGFITRMALGSEDTAARGPTEFIPPNHSNLFNSVSEMNRLTDSMANRYASQEHQVGTLKTPTLDDRQELLLLVDDLTRLQIERGAIPLTEWISQMAHRDMESMDEGALDSHIADLRAIQSESLIEAAFPASGFFETIGRAFDDEFRRLRREVEEAINLGRLLKKRFLGTFTDADAEEVRIAKMSPDERQQYRVQKIVAELQKK